MRNELGRGCSSSLLVERQSLGFSIYDSSRTSKHFRLNFVHCIVSFVIIVICFVINLVLAKLFAFKCVFAELAIYLPPQLWLSFQLTLRHHI
jgi:hypothetical protein